MRSFIQRNASWGQFPPPTSIRPGCTWPGVGADASPMAYST